MQLIVSISKEITDSHGNTQANVICPVVLKFKKKSFAFELLQICDLLTVFNCSKISSSMIKILGENIYDFAVDN